MARIRSCNTSPERILRSALWSSGKRFRLHFRTQYGRPDIVFTRARVAVFVDGCFWHGCPKHYLRPRAASGYWAQKLLSNVRRDRRQTIALEQDGWRVCRVWEHEIFESLGDVVETVAAAIDSPKWVPPRRWRVIAVKPINKDGSIERRYLCLIRGSAKRKVVEGPRTAQMWSRSIGSAAEGRKNFIPHTAKRLPATREVV